MIINGSRPNDDNASNLNQWEKIGTFSLDNIVIKNKNVNAESTRYFPISIDQSITMNTQAKIIVPLLSLSGLVTVFVNEYSPPIITVSAIIMINPANASAIVFVLSES